MAQKLSIADLRISSSAFEDHGRIPARHTVEGEDVSPPLQWSGAPHGTKAFVIVCHDPDAPLVDGFTHWLAYGIPADTAELPEGAGGLVTGTNSYGKAGSRASRRNGQKTSWPSPGTSASGPSPRILPPPFRSPPRVPSVRAQGYISRPPGRPLRLPLRAPLSTRRPRRGWNPRTPRRCTASCAPWARTSADR